MIVYISGAISNEPNYKQRFLKAQNYLESNGYKVINPTALDCFKNIFSYEQFMQIDILMLSFCDTIYMLKGWNKSKGATTEYFYAYSTNKKIIYEK